MSARKIGNSSSLNQKVTFEGRQARLELSAESVAVHKNGIEFRSPTPFNEWAEMTVSITSPRDGSKLQCSGVVIACSGNKHAGYHVSLVFTGMSKQAEARLNLMVASSLGL
ncbi:MAG TPA: PilZ domain-containing protein [Verrucomicrobiae bacterium]|nr:PilZ domain-containing protein [Verrucomicrobiae bacterium]